MDNYSIREFCELDMPIFMFDKNGDFMVARLGEVCATFLFPNYSLLIHAFTWDSACGLEVCLIY